MKQKLRMKSNPTGIYHNYSIHCSEVTIRTSISKAQGAYQQYGMTWLSISGDLEQALHDKQMKMFTLTSESTM